MANNKVEFGDRTVMDITDATAEAGDVLSGKVFYDRGGNRTVGTVVTVPVDTAMDSASKNAVQNKVIKAYVDTEDASLQAQIDALGEPFRLHDFNQSVSGTLLPITSNTAISGASTGRIDIDIGEEMAVNWAIASVSKWEIFNGSTRVDAVPMYSFSMQQQRVLRMGFRTSGTSNKAFTKIQGALLLKHR